MEQRRSINDFVKGYRMSNDQDCAISIDAENDRLKSEVVELKRAVEKLTKENKDLNVNAGRMVSAFNVIQNTLQLLGG